MADPFRNSNASDMLQKSLVFKVPKQPKKLVSESSLEGSYTSSSHPNSLELSLPIAASSQFPTPQAPFCFNFLLPQTPKNLGPGSTGKNSIANGPDPDRTLVGYDDTMDIGDETYTWPQTTGYESPTVHIRKRRLPVEHQEKPPCSERPLEHHRVSQSVTECSEHQSVQSALGRSQRLVLSSKILRAS
jgi:hypothetical protein